MWEAWLLFRPQLSHVLIFYVKLIDHTPVNCPREDLVHPSISVYLPRHCLLIVDKGDDKGRPASCYSQKPTVYPFPALLHILASNLYDMADVSTAPESSGDRFLFLPDRRLS
jgi:hypothetical protein